MAPAAQPQPVVNAADFQKQIDDLKEQVAEGQRTAQYWADKAKAGEPKPAPTPKEDDEDILEVLTTKGGKGFDELLAKRGYVRKEEVDATVNAKAATLAKEAELIGRFPDLKKKDSDFFKATAGHYGDLVKAGTPQHLAMEIAAEKAELEFLRSGKIKMPDTEPTAAQKEATRLRRIAAQAGNDSARPAAGADPDDEELTPEQKRIADGMGVSHEAYAKRAKSGVSMRGGR